jgi:hypothetical protein
MSNPEMPDNPVSALLSSAIHMHELMMSYVEAGFSPEQAFAMIQTVLQASVMVGLVRGSDD